MQKKRVKRELSKVIVNDIENYADIGLFDDGSGYSPLPIHDEEDLYDETDRDWLYEDGGYILEDEDEDGEEEISEDDLWDDDPPAEEEPEEQEEPKGTVPPEPDREAETLMTVVLWLNGIRERGSLTQKEEHYIGLMLSELSNCYFQKNQIQSASRGAQEAMKRIYRKIGASGIVGTGDAEEKAC